MKAAIGEISTVGLSDRSALQYACAAPQAGVFGRALRKRGGGGVARTIMECVGAPIPRADGELRVGGSRGREPGR